MFWKRRRSGQRGQSAVETAIVMPLNIFILLAIIQNGLIAQARVMAKYAAYRAVRIGSMNNARVDMMTNAALTTLLPVIGFPSMSGGAAVFPDMTSVSSATSQIGKALAINTALASTFLQPVKVIICGPISTDLDPILDSQLPAPTGGSAGSANEVDFDDPRAATEWKDDLQSSTNTNGFNSFMRTKLRIQVQFKYPMIIPFANWIISLSYLGQALPDVMRMGGPDSFIPATSTANTTAFQFAQLLAANKRGDYLAPINVSYAMRMQSNIYKAQAPIPPKNLCLSYGTNGS
jgi:hypothetical protein